MIEHSKLLEHKRNILNESKKLHLDNVRIVVPALDGILPSEVIVSSTEEIQVAIENCIELTRYMEEAFGRSGISVHLEQTISNPNGEVWRDMYKRNLQIELVDSSKDSFSEYFE
jgi:hypothetical protein